MEYVLSTALKGGGGKNDAFETWGTASWIGIAAVTGVGACRAAERRIVFSSPRGGNPGHAPFRPGRAGFLCWFRAQNGRDLDFYYNGTPDFDGVATGEGPKYRCGSAGRRAPGGWAEPRKYRGRSRSDGSGVVHRFFSALRGPPPPAPRLAAAVWSASASAGPSLDRFFSLFLA